MAFLVSPVRVSVLMILLNILSVESFVLSGTRSCPGKLEPTRLEATRRDIMISAASAAAFLVALPTAAEAGIDPNALRTLPVEGDSGGATMRLRQIDAGTQHTFVALSRPLFHSIVSHLHLYVF